MVFHCLLSPALTIISGPTVPVRKITQSSSFPSKASSLHLSLSPGQSLHTFIMTHTRNTVLSALWSAFPVRTLKTRVAYSFTRVLILFLKLGAQTPCCSRCFPRCWAETKSQTIILQTHQVSHPVHCAVTLGKHSWWLVCYFQAVKRQ